MGQTVGKRLDLNDTNDPLHSTSPKGQALGKRSSVDVNDKSIQLLDPRHDLWSHILSHMDRHEIAPYRRVSKRWRDSIDEIFHLPPLLLVGSKQRLIEIKSPRNPDVDFKNGPRTIHFDPIHRRWYVLTRKLTLSVTTERGEFLRNTKVPCVSKKQHRFEMFMLHSARDRILRTHCSRCMVLFDIGANPDKEIPHIFEHHELKENMGEACPFTVISNSCHDVATRKVVVYKFDREENLLDSSVTLDLNDDQGSSSSSHQKVNLKVPITNEILLKTCNGLLVFYGGQQRSAIRVVQWDNSTEKWTDGFFVEGSISGITYVMDTPLIAYLSYIENQQQLNYFDLETKKTKTTGPHPKNTYPFCQILTAEGDFHMLLLPGQKTFEFKLQAISMRTGKFIREWIFSVQDPNPALTEQISRLRGCDSESPYHCQGMMVCGSEVLIELGLRHDRYRPRIYSFQIF